MTMNDTRLTLRQFAILDALYMPNRFLSVEEIALRIQSPVLRRDQIALELEALRDIDLVRQSILTSEWVITAKGRARLVVQEAKSVFQPSADETQRALDETAAAAAETLRPLANPDATVSWTHCNAPESPAPAVALLHVEESELDEWWATLDVDDKAEAFAYATFGRRGERAVPVTGTIGKAVQS